MCVRECVRACVRECVCACVRAREHCQYCSEARYTETMESSVTFLYSTGIRSRTFTKLLRSVNNNFIVLSRNFRLGYRE